MAGQTPRFGLNFFGGDTDGALDDDNDKYTSEDRLQLDRVLAALEKHNHRVSAALDVPDGEPTAVGASGAGALEAGQTLYYLVSFVNADGLESVTGPEGSVELPDLLPTPDAPSVVTADTTGGTLSAGLYYFAISGLREEEESPLGEPDAVTVLQDGQASVIVTLPDLGQATSYQVWRMKDTDSGWTRIGTSSTGTFTDDGSVGAGIFGDPANVAPTANTGVGSYSVTVTLTGDDLTNVQNATSWRLYRSDVSGVYTATSLVHEVVEHTSDTDPTTPLLTSWIDDGDAPLTGSPKVSSTELAVPAYVFDTQDPLPATTNYPESYPMVDGAGVLYLQHGGTWTPIAGASRGVGVFTGTGDPTGAEPATSIAGDIYIDTTTGDVYVLTGS